MKNKEILVKPIIIGFDFNNEVCEQLKNVNQTCNRLKGIDFEIHIPHLTLWMGFVDIMSFNKLVVEFYKVFKILTIEIKFDDIKEFKGLDGSVLSLSVSKRNELLLLHNRIANFMEPYRVVIEAYESFNEGTVGYVNSYSGKSMEHYDPHVTIGFGGELPLFSLTSTVVNEPKIFLMGNNCTCLEVIPS